MFHLHDWVYFNASNGVIHPRDFGVSTMPARRICRRCGKEQRREVHCLGMNPPEFHHFWNTTHKPQIDMTPFSTRDIKRRKTLGLPIIRTRKNKVRKHRDFFWPLVALSLLLTAFILGMAYQIFTYAP